MKDRFCHNPKCPNFNITNFHGDRVCIEIQGKTPLEYCYEQEIRRFEFYTSKMASNKYFCEVCANAIFMVTNKEV